MKKISKVLSYVLLGAVSLVSLFPFYLMLTMSTYKTEEIFKGMPLLPSGYLVENLKTVFQSNFV